MESAKDILFELRHKEKKISDLVRFLSIRCDETPNYSLLMGAGCSITSGIKSGTQLINDWKKEIIEYADDYDTSITSDEYFEKQNWFDERNPYSSLFEKRYDLQRQRRAFVENEVANKNPSIGYAYLVKLIENNYFNAIFTTNFDDLLNEAFYRFSNVRPVVCAHDSAITSITVTSKRPKIIKLHGDYLFEDIKSTLRETESLEGNMKNKFIEFSKDYGLIVVGYAGNDRSIMDILSFLLKKEEFFKNGIYWCIRKGDENISDDLKKLLWKDKVFFIQIEGFDELMAELNKRLNKGVLPIDNAILSSEHQIKLIKSLTSNEYVEKSNSKIIQEDSKRLKKMVNHNIFEDFFKHVDVKKEKKDNTTRKDSSSKISEEEKKTLNKVRILFLEDETEQAYKLINEQKLEDSDNSSYKAELLEMKLALLHNMNLENNIEYKQTIDSLIAIKPNTEMYYIEAVNSFPEIKDKIEYIDKAIAIYPNDYSLYRKKGDFMADYYNSLINKEESDIAPNAITTCYLTSIKLDGSIFNKAWVNLCDWYSHLYKKENEKKKEEILSLLKKYKEQNEYHPNYLKVCHRYSNMINEKIDKLLINGYSFAKQTDDPTWVESTVLILLDYFEERENAYIVMEFVQGISLRQYLESRNQPMSFTEAWNFLLPVMEALEKVHQNKLIHRDISPDNFIIKEDGSIKLLDFGSAREYAEEKTMTVLVKKGYAPPEQYSRKGKQGPWTDIYSICATLYEMITGVIPQPAMERLKADKLYLPSSYGCDITPLQEKILMKGLALDYKKRYKDIAELKNSFFPEKQKIRDSYMHCMYPAFNWSNIREAES